MRELCRSNPDEFSDRPQYHLVDMDGYKAVLYLFAFLFGGCVAMFGGKSDSIRGRIRNRVRHRMPKIFRIAKRFRTLHIQPGVRIHEGLRGKRDGHAYYAFVIHNDLGADPDVVKRWETHFVFESGIDIGRVLVTPASLDHHLTRAFGTTDIRVESAAFNDAFHVTADQREEAYAFLGPLVIETLLGYPKVILELAPDWCLLSVIDGDFQETPLGDVVGLGFEMIGRFPRHLHA